MTSHQYRMKGSLSYSLTITHNALYRSIKPEERLSKFLSEILLFRRKIRECERGRQGDPFAWE